MNNQITITAESINTYKRKTVHKQVFFIAKRAFDLFVAILALPLLGLTAVIVKILYVCTGDFAPIFYSHKRLGKNGKEFMLHKFRTMVRNSDDLLAELLRDPTFHYEWHSDHKLADDPRITKVGKLLRRSSIDELPQIIDIILGHMSLIGPRPITRPEVEAYGADQQLLLSLRPGLTGWWACNGRSCTSNAKRQELELYYCEHASILLDLKCFTRTIVKVITQEGAR